MDDCSEIKYDPYNLYPSLSYSYHYPIEYGDWSGIALFSVQCTEWTMIVLISTLTHAFDTLL